MTDQHPITPPPELVEQWHSNSPLDRGLTLATRAAQWGADQELEACATLMPTDSMEKYLRTARRPKPPSEAEQALEVFEALIHGDASELDVGVIRRALERLKKMEQLND